MIAALCSIDVKWEDKEYNMARIEKLLDSFCFSPDVVFFPEMFTTGFTMDISFAEPMEGKTLSWMQSLAKRYGFAVAGSIPIYEIGRERVFNRFLFVAPEGLLGFYDKRHLFRMGGEIENYTRGEESRIISYKGVNFLLNICYDLRFPVWSRNIDNRWDVLVNVANFPASRRAVIEPLIKARAIENSAYALFVNRVGEDTLCSYEESSYGVNFKGEIISEEVKEADLSRFGEGSKVYKVTIDKEKLDHFRSVFQVWRDADQFKIEN